MGAIIVRYISLTSRAATDFESDTVVYIATTDPRFGTDDGIHVGSTLAEVRDNGGEEPADELGFCVRSKLRSGWYAEFGAATGSGVKLDPSAVVVRLFERQRG